MIHLINFLKSFLHAFKLDVKKYPNIDLRRRKKLLDTFQISKILDVGANSGQYASETFKLGFKGEIVSFEPVTSTFNILNRRAHKKKNWTAFNYGLGHHNGVLNINLSKNTYSSSLLDIMPSHLLSAAESIVVNQEKVSIKKLDDIFKNITNDKDVILLKIDVQGYEKMVLEGAESSLKCIKGIQLEMSLEELYKGELLYIDMISLIKSYGYTLYSLENGFYNDKTGKLLQVDGIFFRE